MTRQILKNPNINEKKQEYSFLFQFIENIPDCTSTQLTNDPSSSLSRANDVYDVCV